MIFAVPEGIGDILIESTAMQTARSSLSARSLNRPSSQFDPTHGFHWTRSDKEISASRAILAQLGPVACVSRDPLSL